METSIRGLIPLRPAPARKAPETIRRTEAIVLNTSDYGESDRLVTFYTKEGGKIRGIAKGARRSNKRFVHAFEPCSSVDLSYKERKSLVWIDACKLREPHLELRTEIARWGYAALVSEIILEMIPEGECQEEIYFLLEETLGRLSESRDPLNVVLPFFIRFFDSSGCLPALDACHVCKCGFRERRWWRWMVSEGKLLCPEHGSMGEEGLELDLGTLILIRRIRELPLDKMWRLCLRQDLKHPVLHAFTEWVRRQTGRDLKSLELLRQLRLG
jgi:DNA repair protein RecO (recombination protein O)